MGIRRTALPFEGQFVQVPNAWVRDPRLTRRARGLLVEIMSHQHGWVISVHALWKAGPEGREATRKAIAELAEAGYLERDQEHGDHGRFGEMNYRLVSPGTLTAAQKLGDGTKTGARSTVAQESAPIEDHLEEDHSQKGGATAPAAATPFCKRHPNGTDKPCSGCKAARLAVAVAEAEAHAAAAKPKRRYDPTVYCEHLQLLGACDICAAEAGRAATA